MSLTDDEIRIKVAEAIGWNAIPSERPSSLGHLIAFAPDGTTAFMPNYTADLNACAEFEATLTDEEWDVYEDSLIRTVNSGHIKVTRCRLLISATARQRCLAFLKTKGILP